MSSDNYKYVKQLKCFSVFMPKTPNTYVVPLPEGYKVSMSSIFDDDDDTHPGFKTETNPWLPGFDSSTDNYRLSADEIKKLEQAAVDKFKKELGYTPAIHEVLQAAKDKLTPPDDGGGDANAPLPHQFTFEQWNSAGTGYGTPKPTGTEASKCAHDWKVYHGFHFSDLYCVHCNQTRPLDPSK